VHLSSLGKILQTPLDSWWAVPVGGSGGLVAGGLVGLLRDITNGVVPGALLGGFLGAFATLALQARDARETQDQLQPHERALVDYPGVRALLLRANRSSHDRAAVREISLQLTEQFGRVIRLFEEYCAHRGLTPHPLIAQVIRHFFLTHCSDRGVLLVSKRSVAACYLIAAHREDKSAIAAAMNDGDVPAGTALRRLRCPYLRVDLANEDLGPAQAFFTEVRRGGEWSVHPAPAWSDGEEASQTRRVRDVHRRTRNAPCETPPSPVPTAPSLVSAPRLSVTRSPLLRATLVGLPPDSRTWRELNRIEEDLATNRPRRRHLVTYQGNEYIAFDIHWDGRRSPGRNAWRLLVNRVAGGFLLVDIVDYHR